VIDNERTAEESSREKVKELLHEANALRAPPLPDKTVDDLVDNGRVVRILTIHPVIFTALLFNDFSKSQ
jgi:phosphoenolpyruvate carboxylase